MNKIMGVDMYDIESSHIESVGYNGDTMEMLVKFKDRVNKDGTVVPGSVTKYMKIPGRHADKIRTSDSAGKYLNEEIKGKYEYVTYKNEKKAGETK